MLITRKLNEQPRFELLGIQLKLSENVKILGVTIDRNLNFLQHLEEVSLKAITLFRAISKAATAQWGLNPEILRTLYTVPYYS